MFRMLLCVTALALYLPSGARAQVDGYRDIKLGMNVLAIEKILHRACKQAGYARGVDCYNTSVKAINIGWQPPYADPRFTQTRVNNVGIQLYTTACNEEVLRELAQKYGTPLEELKVGHDMGWISLERYYADYQVRHTCWRHDRFTKEDTVEFVDASLAQHWKRAAAQRLEEKQRRPTKPKF